MRSAAISIPYLAFAFGAATLAISPVLWLLGTWRDPAFASNGGCFFFVVAVAFAWSMSSRQVDDGDADRGGAVALLAATALVRLAGQVLAIDTIGALALAIDVYALARLLRLGRRVRALSPGWLAVAFAFSLPLERIVQRCLGYGLQEISAGGACAVLSAASKHVTCEGVRIGVDGADVMVDLPCSGSQALVVFGFVFALAAALTRPRPPMALAGLGIALAAAVLGNVARIALLAAGVAQGPARLGFDVMAQPWHDLVGLTTLGLSAVAVFLWARAVSPAPLRRRQSSHARPLSLRLAIGFALASLAVVSAPHEPVDVGQRAVAIEAPERIGPYRAEGAPLTAVEDAYFRQFGGAAVKAHYGPYALLLTRTSAPLRHLHAPDECLRGVGYRVDYVGLRFAPTLSARYRAVAPDGRAYFVDTSFVSDRGRVAASVAEAVWIWLGDRSTVWTAVQRVAPADSDPREQALFERGVAAALDLPAQAQISARRT